MRDPDEGNEFCRPAPPETLARVTASDLLGSEGGQPIGYALASPLGTAIGANHGPTDPHTPSGHARTLAGQHSAAAVGRCVRSRLGYPSCLG
jgi:hypothetical protein